MVGRAKSEHEKKRIQSASKAALERKAVERYREELQKKEAGEKAMGAKAVCNEVMVAYRRETGKIIKLNHCTIINRIKGKPSRAEANALQRWLSPAEEDVVVQFAIESGNRGFPLNALRLKEHVDEILRARLGPDAPERGVGKNWVKRFLKRHRDKLKTSWSTPLESKRGRAVNPNNNDAWFQLLQKTVKEYGIVEETTYATDEIGVAEAIAERERVIGAQKAGPQYQQIAGNRENTTVIVTICANGLSIAPTVIFKGKAYHAKMWDQENPTDARYVSIQIIWDLLIDNMLSG